MGFLLREALICILGYPSRWLIGGVGEGVTLEGLQLTEGLLPTCSMMKMSCLKWVMCKHDGLTSNSIVDTLLNCEMVFLESQCFT